MFRDFAKTDIILFDGAMGTAIQRSVIPDDIWKGRNGCNEFLNLVSPDTIYNIHKSYFEAGANIAVTNTFGAIRSVLSEYDLADKVAEINRAGIDIARRAASGYKNAFVGHSIGPGTKLASLCHTTYDELYDQYIEQVEGTCDVDIYMIETAQDIIQMKAAVNACRSVMQKCGKDIPIIVSFTLEKDNNLLTGSDIASVAAVMRGLPIFGLGLNCALGPDMMIKPLEILADNWGGNIYLSPNAGLPESINGCTVYPMAAEQFAEIFGSILSRIPLSCIGGCCGTDTTHIAALRTLLDNTAKIERDLFDYNGLSSSLYSVTNLTQEPAPAIVGERANATGSKAFRELLLNADTDGIIALCKKQEEEGAHFIDLSTAYAGRNELQDYKNLVPKLNTSLTKPLMIDSTDPEVIEESLKRYSGKPIINSINLEDGGVKLHKILNIVKRHPACVVALTIDENGMAQSAMSKLAVAKRLYDIWVNEYNFDPQDLIIDSLTFSIGSGDETLKTAATETIEAITLIKSKLKGVKTILGVSNISFGLSAGSRPLLNSVFLELCVNAGLDMAIVHASKLIGLTSLSVADKDICLNLIYNKPDGLMRFIEHFSNFKAEKVAIDPALPADKLIAQKVIKGDKSGLNELIDKLLVDYGAEDIINKLLFPAMQEVGVMFGAGKMLLPFVLQSAECMKAAVSVLEPKLKKNSDNIKGVIVLATVKGDVHDIGKNLVDIILSNNGYKVYNLGIKVGVEEMIAKAKETKAQSIGMSGLLVKSTIVMKENIEIIEKELPDIKIMLGGAALTSKFVKQECAPIMPGKVFYCKDAFDNIGVLDGSKEAEKSADNAAKMSSKDIEIADIGEADIPAAPFYGVRQVSGISLEKVFDYLNLSSLFTTAWGYKRKGLSETEYQDMIKGIAMPELEELKLKLIKSGVIKPLISYGYFKARSVHDAIDIYDETGNIRFKINLPDRKLTGGVSLADYISKREDRFDVLPMQIVTLGQSAADYCKKLFDGDSYKEYYMTHGLLTELTEALAEIAHKSIREELNIAHDDAVTTHGLLNGIYRGRRYSFGYRAVPDLEYNYFTAELLNADKIGVEVGTTFQMTPEYTTSALLIHHPKARY